MLADLDETIRQLLLGELSANDGEIELSFEMPRRDWSARLSRPTVNLYLYDVRENNVLRQHQWEDTSSGHNGEGRAHLKRSPLRVDCLYLLSTWASDAEDEHRLLSRCLLALFRYPILPAERLVGRLKGQPYEIQARLASHDKLTNPAEVWGALANELRPSISYVVTLALDPWTEVEKTRVETLTLTTALVKSPARLKQLDEFTRPDQLVIPSRAPAKNE